MIPMDNLRQVVANMVSSGLLKMEKKSEVNEEAATTVLTLNLGYVNKKTRVNINVPIKEEVKASFCLLLFLFIYICAWNIGV